METISVYDENFDVITELTQWDYGVTIYLIDDAITEDASVHFANARRGPAYSVLGTYASGMLAAKIPDIVLQAPTQIYGYVFDGDSDSGQAILQFEIGINRRAKPLDYIESDNTDYVTVSSTIAAAEDAAEAAAASAEAAAASAEAAANSETGAAASAEAAAASAAEAQTISDGLEELESGDLEIRLALLEQMVLTNSYSVPIEVEDDDSDDLTLLVDDLGYAIMADWKYEIA